MRSKVLRRVVVSILCGCLGWSARPAEAQGISQGQAVGILVAFVAVGAAIGVGIYFVVRQSPSITGCAVAHGNGLSLENESDHQVFLLAGAGPEIRAGERVRVKGRKQKKDALGQRGFLVEKMTKDFGACKADPATP